MSAISLTDTRRWRAIVRRDPRYDDAFVYGVKTTNVFCKPSCSSRRPNKVNVIFFGSGDAAKDAGYRECSKCRPLSGPEAERIVRVALDFLENRLDQRVTLMELAQHVAMSPFYLQRLFKRHVGVSPRIYVATRRAERLKAHLREKDSVAQASISAGYADERAAYSDARRALGMTPGQYRRRGAGKVIAFRSTKTPLGYALIAATTRGVAAVYLGDDRQRLEADLRAEYPKAKFLRYSDRLDALTKAHLESAEETIQRQILGSQGAQIKLDLEGTPFQSAVWRALQEIPSGQTRTYNEVAASIGRPGASRAVAMACASNRVALVIPCHRVIRADGGLASYRWGGERKKALLQAEKAS